MLSAIMCPYMTGKKVWLDDVEVFMKNQELPEMARFTLRENKLFLYAFLHSRPSINIMTNAIHHICENPRNVVIFMQSFNDNILNAEPYVQDVNASRKKLTQIAMKKGVPIFNVKEEAIAYVLGKLKGVF